MSVKKPDAVVTVKLYGSYADPKVEITGNMQDTHLRITASAIKNYYMSVYCPKRSLETRAKEEAYRIKTEDLAQAAIAKADTAFDSLDQNYSDMYRLKEIVVFYSEVLTIRPDNQLAPKRIKILEDQLEYLKAERDAQEAKAFEDAEMLEDSTVETEKIEV